ncbi:MAG: RNA-binding domain-containing protein [Promethearchaeota archaeon]
MDYGDTEMVSKSSTGSSAQIKLRQIEIRTFIHATESSSKVISPIAKFLHSNLDSVEKIESVQKIESAKNIEESESVGGIEEIEKTNEFEDDRFNPVQCTGSHGQSIDSLVLKITNQKEIQGFLKELGHSLPLNVKTQLDSELAQRCDEKFKIFLRFDKQAAILGNYVLVTHSDVYVIILAFQNKNPQYAMTLEDIRTYLKQYHLLTNI